MNPPWIDLESGPLVIAEVGVNHNGAEEVALALIEAAAAAGADVVKFQTFRAAKAVSVEASTAPYQEQRTGESSQGDLLRNLELPDTSWALLSERAAECGVSFMSTAFDHASLMLIDALAPPAHKIPSGELTNLDYLGQVAACGRPIILSTGMATVEEISQALGVIGDSVPVALLHCVTAYPAPTADLNLLSVPFLEQHFGLPTGWSDHSEGVVAGVAAVALGAVIVERHITLDCAMPGPDHAASLEPDDFTMYVEAVREAWVARGTWGKDTRPSEVDNMYAARRSWHAVRDLQPESVVGAADVMALRPLSGIPVNQKVIGGTVLRAVRAGEPLQATDIDLGGFRDG